jgi:Suppressor of fused protein (SUFU)
MSNSNKKEEISPGGSHIYRYKQTTLQTPPAKIRYLHEITTHITKHLGEISIVFHEEVSDVVHVDVHHVKPNARNPYHRLITSGMSDLPMRFPEEFKTPYSLELIVTLPPYWRLDMESFKNEDWYWPVRIIKSIARFPHKYNTWLARGHTLHGSNPPKPYASNTNLQCALLLPSPTVPDDFDILNLDPDPEIRFLAVVPIYEDELNFKLQFGLEELLEKFEAAGLTDLIDPQRQSVL